MRSGGPGSIAARPAAPGRPRYWPRQALCRLPCQPDSRRHRPPTPGNPSPDQIEQASRASRELCDAPGRELRDGRQLAAPVIVATRLRKGSTNSARGAPRLVADALAAATAAGAGGPPGDGLVVLRADSAFYGHDVVTTARRGSGPN